jgi:predicted flap endonuclease-1-like 5' DNA nuclease
MYNRRTPAPTTLVESVELPLNQISSVSTEAADKLQQLGLATNLDLLRSAGMKSQRQALAEQVGVTVQQINRWVVLADLTRVPSVGTVYADFLLQIGICSTLQLANTPISDLQRQVNRYQMPILKQASLCPGMGLIATWSTQAKQLKVKRAAS